MSRNNQLKRKFVNSGVIQNAAFYASTDTSKNALFCNNRRFTIPYLGNRNKQTKINSLVAKKFRAIF